MYEHTLRIRMVVMGPGIAAGVQLSHLGTNVDLAPTFLELVGVEPPSYMDGHLHCGHMLHPREYLPRAEMQYQCSLTKENCTVRKLDDESNTCISTTTHPAALTGYWKLAEFQNNCEAVQLDCAALRCFDNLTTTELFDLKNDPHELTNMAATAPPASMHFLWLSSRAPGAEEVEGAAATVLPVQGAELTVICQINEYENETRQVWSVMVRARVRAGARACVC